MRHPARASRTYRWLARVLRPVLRTVTRTTWTGAEHLETGGGVIVVANHVTELDPLTLAHYLYDHGRVPRILAKDSLFRVPVLGPAMRSTGQIPVSRGAASASRSLEAAVAALAAGECVVIFPEGTLTRDPGLWPMTAKTGAVRLAALSGAPLVPVAQWGAHRVLGRYARVPRLLPPSPVAVAAGPPVDLSGLDLTDPAGLREGTERMTAALTALLAGLRQDAPPERPYDVRRDGERSHDEMRADPEPA